MQGLRSSKTRQNEIIKTGLNEFITTFVEGDVRLGQKINGQYLLHCRAMR